MVRAVDPFGNASDSPLTWTVDPVVPTTSFTAWPETHTNAATLRAMFTSDVAGATFECRLGEEDWRDCDGGVWEAALAEGTYALQVRAIVDGVADETPAVRAFTVDRTPPRIEIVDRPGDDAPEDVTIVTRVDDPAATVTCALDGAPAAACDTRLALTGLAPGPRAVVVRAADRAGNVAIERVAWTTAARARDTGRPVSLVGARRITCDADALGLPVVAYEFWRDGRVVRRGDRGHRPRVAADDGAVLACGVTVRMGGATRTVRSRAVLVSGGQVVRNLSVTGTARRPVVTFDARRSGLVLLRVWCRAGTPGAARCVTARTGI